MPTSVLNRLEQCVIARARIVISAITYSEMRFGTIGPKAKAKHTQMVDAFVKRLDSVVPWDAAAVDQTTQIHAVLRSAGTPIGNNDAAIAGHAIALRAVLVTNNAREFQRVPGLTFEDWK
jgi:tRNA(fMet)-specific endonuclease VapC